MSRTAKLIVKLRSGRLTGAELVTLLGKLGWRQMRQSGSHQTWSNGERILIVIAGRMNLKPYQIKEAQKALLGG
ncbi:MAG: type II toxin-antitoxin system HicA family toxin [Deltaproteobacteria bacterium]|nr:type II toxin-antitoxin system HicA family toxin [Deltaproteobacteria bacterium]